MKIRMTEIEKVLAKLSNEIELLEDGLVQEINIKEKDLNYKLENWNRSDLDSIIRRNYIWKSDEILEVMRDFERNNVDYNENDLVENVIDKLR